jgi:hypothetical protein
VRAVEWLGFACGLVLLLTTGASVVKTFLIPRGTHSRFTAAVAAVNYRVYSLLTARIEDLARREQVLAAAAPTFLLGLLASWIACLFTGYALLFWPLSDAGFAAALRESGSSLFTLGFAPPRGAGPAAIVFVAAASGLAVVALLIAYLPVLYAAYNRRETLVSMLEALAGAPPWGPELLARQALIDNVGTLPGLYERWTQWAADISESHVNYRSLIYFRSPDPAASWLLSLLAVLDGAALHLALCPSSAPSEARPLMRVGYIAMRRLAAGLRLTVADDPRPDDPLLLTRQEFDEAVEWLRGAGWPLERSADAAWPHFRGSRCASICRLRCGQDRGAPDGRPHARHCGRTTAGPAARRALPSRTQPRRTQPSQPQPRRTQPSQPQPR